RVLAAALALLVVVLAWLLWHRGGDEGKPAPAPPPTRTPNAAATPALAPTAAIGFRLAGTALGLHGRYAVLADPDGTPGMYRLGDEVPGLGTVARIGEYDAVVNREGTEMRFQVRPAPTKVPQSTPTARRVRTPSPRRAPSESESSPSDEPAPPAS